MMDRGSEIAEAVDFNIWAERASGSEEVSVEIPETISSPSQRRLEGQTIGRRGGLSESGGTESLKHEAKKELRSFAFASGDVAEKPL